TAAKDTLDSLQGVMAKADPATLRQEEVKLKAEEEALALKVLGTKKQIQETELEAEKLNQKLGDVRKSLANLDSQLRVEAANRTQHQDAIDRAGKLLPTAWRDAAAKSGLAEQNRWKAELESLVEQGTEAK